MTVQPLPDELTMRGADPALLWDDYLQVWTRWVNNKPRNLQVRLGPSELGDPCMRKLGYKLLQIPDRPMPVNWKAAVGTGMHAEGERAFEADNHRLIAEGLLDSDRWIIEPQLTVGFVPGYGMVTGHSDLYDRVTATNLDHKFLGPTTLKKYRKEPPVVYKAQAHLYGQGWVNAGLPIDRVAICILPRNGELRDGYMWSEPFNPAAAKWALDRLHGIHVAVTALGTRALDVLEAAESYCSHCSFYKTGSTDLARGCPAVAGAVNTTSPLAGLLETA